MLHLRGWQHTYKLHSHAYTTFDCFRLVFLALSPERVDQAEGAHIAHPLPYQRPSLMHSAGAISTSTSVPIRTIREVMRLANPTFLAMYNPGLPQSDGPMSGKSERPASPKEFG
jgi:hypothetical protein